MNREALWLTSYNTTSPLYTLTATLNALRARVISMKPNNFLTYKIRTVYTDANTIVTRKGATGNQIVGVYSNLGENGQSYNLTLAKNATGFVAGEAVMEVLSCTLLTADKKGNLAVPMAAGMPRILYPYAQVEGTRICQTYTSTSPAPRPPKHPTHLTDCPPFSPNRPRPLPPLHPRHHPLQNPHKHNLRPIRRRHGLHPRPRHLEPGRRRLPLRGRLHAAGAAVVRQRHGHRPAGGRAVQVCED